MLTTPSVSVMNSTSLPFDIVKFTSLDALKLQRAFQHVPALRHLETKHLFSAPFTCLVVFLCYLIWLSSSTTPVVKGPVAGYRNFLDPTFFLRLRFVWNGVGIMTDGYNKVRYIRLVDGDTAQYLLRRKVQEF